MVHRSPFLRYAFGGPYRNIAPKFSYITVSSGKTSSVIHIPSGAFQFVKAADKIA